ncbi:MAG TPA: hypothetical protein P5256_00340 [Beijerinckiaceae bacterium]|nr:hypothetical protein [Rhodoblastus sp.]MCC2107210.1 hypothetical protein [Hyphomicrobiales bacterium]MCO5088645.1 hypothetical protein [Methylobacteriaceae bacterium]HRY01544.1 hypothetical protein [Beijerinckiaceae bacterium]
MIGIEAAPEDGAGKRPSLADRFADMAQAAYVKAGRGSLDLAGLHGTDIKGFVGAPRDAQGKEMGGEALQEAVAQAPVGGLGKVLGEGFEERSFETARRMNLGRPERDGLGRGE